MIDQKWMKYNIVTTKRGTLEMVQCLKERWQNHKRWCCVNSQCSRYAQRALQSYCVSLSIHSFVFSGASTFSGVPMIRLFRGCTLFIAMSARLSSSSKKSVISCNRHSWRWTQNVLSPTSSSSDIIVGTTSCHLESSDERTWLLLLSYFCKMYIQWWIHT